MSSYAFRAVDVAGVPSRGEVDAESKSQVTEQLRERGLIVLDVSEKNEAFRFEKLFDRFRGIKMRELSVFAGSSRRSSRRECRCFARSTRSRTRREDERLEGAIGEVRQDVEAGSSLADAMERRPQVFDPLFRAMVRSGESSGRLEEALDRVAYQLEKMDELRRQIRSALLYPAFVFTVAIVIMLAVVIFIVPVFVKVFKDVVQDQPGVSVAATPDDPDHRGSLQRGHRLLVHLDSGCDRPGGRLHPVEEDRVGAGAVGPGEAAPAVPHRRRGQKVALARWSRTFSGTVSSGVPILQSIKLVGQTSGNA